MVLLRVILYSFLFIILSINVNGRVCGDNLKLALCGLKEKISCLGFSLEGLSLLFTRSSEEYLLYIF